MTEHKPENGEGREALWLWFGLSRASWLTLPRVLMHAMPDEWQAKMAALLNEYDEAFPNQSEVGTRVQVVNERQQLIATPDWIKNYRRPDRDVINKLRGDSNQ
jgi:hypothetical protein